MQWQLSPSGFRPAIGSPLQQDAPGRVDVVAEHLPRRRRAWIELLGLLLIVLPLVVIILFQAWPFVMRAYNLNEVSAAPGGLTHRWAIKSVILIGFGFLGIAAFSRLLRVTSFLFGTPAPKPD
jgi:TRAP-type mannitol/chloroaromatic compound transport system permease small subunit